jgi:hypothetical protein
MSKQPTLSVQYTCAQTAGSSACERTKTFQIDLEACASFEDFKNAVASVKIPDGWNWIGDSIYCRPCRETLDFAQHGVGKVKGY